jgi:L-malate glycosyltransferase
LQAMAYLRPAHEKLYCLIAGSGHLLADLQRFCRENNIANRVYFLGNISKMAPFYAGLDVYVQPSLSEGFSNSILEAMAAGCPVVATEAGGNSDVLQDGLNGYLFPVGNCALLAECITKILDSKEQAGAMSYLNRTKISKSYSMGEMVARYVSFYRGIIHK